jgi:hypothetical protein
VRGSHNKLYSDGDFGEGLYSQPPEHAGHPIPPPSTDALLQDSGDLLLQDNGDLILLG